MRLNDEQRKKIKDTFIDYNGHRVTKNQRKILRKYDITISEDRGRAHFVYGSTKVRAPSSRAGGGVGITVASTLIKLIEGKLLEER